MLLLRHFVAAAALLGACLNAPTLRAADATFGNNLVDVKLALPNGDSYIRGSADPVQNLMAEITLTNTSKKEDKNKKSETVNTAERLPEAEVTKIEARETPLTEAEIEEARAKLKGSKTIETMPVNQESLGIAFVEPQLGPHDNIIFQITKAGEQLPEGVKPRYIARDEKPSFIQQTDTGPTRYLPAGEASPPFLLPVGKHYLINEPGVYKMKAILKLIPDARQASGYAESNEVEFKVLPYKKVDQRIEDLQQELTFFERGAPVFDFTLFQVRKHPQYDELYSAQRLSVRGSDRIEWLRLCSVKYGTEVQVAQLTPKKIAVLAVHAKGDAGLYTIDYSKPGAKVETKIVPVKDGATPKLRVEGETVTVE